MKKFLQASGAITIGLIIGAILTFPFLAIGTIVGWLFIAEELDN